MTKPAQGALPAPLTPADCNLQDFTFMPLDVARLRDSDMAAYVAPDACWAAVLLWAAAWHQVPAASLPDDDRFLAKAAGYGRVVKEWMSVRDGALHGWVKCSDGRLYHPVVAEKALESWKAKLQHAWKKECDRIRKSNKQRETEGKPALPFPPEPVIDSANIPLESRGIPPESDNESEGNLALNSGNPTENTLKGQGEGQGQGELKSNPESSSQASTEVGARQHRDDDRSGKRCTEIVSLLRQHGIEAFTTTATVCLTWAPDPRVTDDVLVAAIARASKAKPGEAIPVKYLERTVDTILGEQARAQSAPAKPALAPHPPAPRKPQGLDPKGTDESYAEYEARITKYELAQRNGGKAA